MKLTTKLLTEFFNEKEIEEIKVIREEKHRNYTYNISQANGNFYALMQYKNAKFRVQIEPISHLAIPKIKRLGFMDFINKHSLFFTNSKSFKSW